MTETILQIGCAFVTHCLCLVLLCFLPFLFRFHSMLQKSTSMHAKRKRGRDTERRNREMKRETGIQKRRDRETDRERHGKGERAREKENLRPPFSPSPSVSTSLFLWSFHILSYPVFAHFPSRLTSSPFSLNPLPPLFVLFFVLTSHFHTPALCSLFCVPVLLISSAIPTLCALFCVFILLISSYSLFLIISHAPPSPPRLTRPPQSPAVRPCTPLTQQMSTASAWR